MKLSFFDCCYSQKGRQKKKKKAVVYIFREGDDCMCDLMRIMIHSNHEEEYEKEEHVIWDIKVKLFFRCVRYVVVE